MLIIAAVYKTAIGRCLKQAKYSWKLETTYFHFVKTGSKLDMSGVLINILVI